MSERVSWINHKGKRILYVDFSELKKFDDIIEVIGEAKKEVLGGKDVLVLFNTVGSRGSPAVIKEFNSFLNDSKENIKKDAMYLVSDVHRVFMRSIRVFTGMSLKDFASLDEAKDYLVE